MTKRNALDVLSERGFVKQTVFEDDLRKLLDKESVTFYCGFDPTADSLHIGHYIPIMAMAHMQRCGHKPIALIGGGTAMIGDPSGRSDMRQLMTKEIIEGNSAAFREQFKLFLNFEGENGVIMVNNADWLLSLNYIEFLRDVGVYFSVNKMLTHDCFKTRMEKGLSFFELNYMPMQAYDFYVLFSKYACKLQIGGNDQWGNMLAGADLIRRKEQADAYAVTLSLLETADGVKMGKTQKGALWLDSNKTTPYEFYQYFRNVDDGEVENCLKLLTFVELDEIAELVKHKDERINEAKKRLAYEVTKLVHGTVEAEKAANQAAAAFSGNLDAMPCVELKKTEATTVVDVLLLSGAAATKSDARRLIEGGGVKINDQKITAINCIISDITKDTEFVLHKGKKFHVKVILS